MFEANLPDILGYITGGPRLNASVVQLALAVRPRVTRAGRPFEAILLIQNACDQNVDVTATLQLPETDAKKKPKRFLAKSARLVVGLRPAEVGYVVLPLSSLPDTAVSDGYKVGMSVEVKPLHKPSRVRAADGHGEVTLEDLPDEVVAKINDLKKLTFSTTKRGLVGTSIEVPFSVMSAQVGQLVDLKPGWVSIWKMSDLKDERLLLARYGELLTDKVLLALKREAVYPPLYQTTLERVNNSGYELQLVEAHYIAKLLTALLEMAKPDEETIDQRLDDAYNVSLLLKKGASTADAVELPSWCKGLLRAIDKDTTVVERLPEVLASTLYDELLRDAVRYGFNLLSKSTGQDLGSEEEIRSYGEALIQKFIHPEERAFTFLDVYLPLAMSGIVLYDKAIMPEEKVGETLKEMLNAIEGRAHESDEDTQLVHQMAAHTIDRALQKFGYRA